MFSFSSYFALHYIQFCALPKHVLCYSVRAVCLRQQTWLCHITGLDPVKDAYGKPALAYVPPEDKPLLMKISRKAMEPFHHQLSDRERQVMFMIAEGKTMKENAADLCLGYKTIATYRNRVLEKMNMKTNTEIVRYVISKGLI